MDIMGLLTADAPANSLGNAIGTSISVISGTGDLVKSISNFNSGDFLGGIDSTVDLVIDMVGFAGVEGACISVGLKYSKKACIFGAYQMGKAQIELERNFVNNWSDFMFGIKFK